MGQFCLRSNNMDIFRHSRYYRFVYIIAFTKLQRSGLQNSLVSRTERVSDNFSFQRKAHYNSHQQLGFGPIKSLFGEPKHVFRDFRIATN